MGSFGQGAKGAAGGAMTGATIGSVIPGVGTAVGAIGGGLIGGLAGYFGGDGPSNPHAPTVGQRAQTLEEIYGNRVAPQAGPAAQADYSQFRGNQQQLISYLEAMSRGQAPSLAEAQLRSATDRNQAGQRSMAAGRVGPSNALGNFQAANNSAQLGAMAAQDAATARIQEQQMALQQLGLTLHGARGADEGLNTFNANEQNQQAQANLQAKLQAMGINTKAQLDALLLQLQAGGASLPQGAGLGDSIMAGGATVASIPGLMNSQGTGITPASNTPGASYGGRPGFAPAGSNYAPPAPGGPAFAPAR